jgi:WD40 repeat protein
MTATTAARQLDSENPWPGLESFGESAHDFFFGREREAESLLNHVRDASVTVLYGRSGLGKTSLLQAGLFPALREENFLPVYVRLDLQQSSAALSRQLHQSVYDSIQTSVPDALLPAEDQSLWEYLHRSDFELWSAQNYPLTPVIVIDQFEELFTLGERVPDLVQEFMNDLGDLAENRIPADVAARIDNDEAEAVRFQLRAHNYKLLITLREDFLPHLEEWSQLIPALKRSRVRLLPLRADKAFDAVYKPAAHLMSAGLAERVVRIVAGEDLGRSQDSGSSNGDRSDGRRALGVEPALLSLFCRELNEERKRRGQSEFDEHLVEDAKRDILANYYLSCVRDLPPVVAEFIESELITEKGFRDSYAREDAVPSRLTEDELSGLIGSRLLRLEEYHGAQRIELTHDVLTGVVREHRDRRRAEAEKMALAARAEEEKQALTQAAERHAAELDRERQAGRKFRKLSLALALVCIAAVVLAGVAFFNGRSLATARNAADEASLNRKAEWLYGQSQLMLAGQSPLGGNDETAMQLALAAYARSTDDDRNSELLTALNHEPDLLKIIDMPTQSRTVALSPDGSRMVSSNEPDNAMQLWDAGSGKPIGQPLRGNTNFVGAVAFSPDGSRVVSGDSEGTVRMWDVGSGQLIGHPLRSNASLINGVAFNPDGSRIAAACADKTVRLWDVASGKPIGQPLRGHTDWVRTVAFSADGRRIATGGDDKTVRLWDAVTLQPVGQPLRDHTDWVRSVAFSADGHLIATGGDDTTVRLWDAHTLQAVGNPMNHGSSVTSVVFSPNSARIVTAGTGKTIQLWDAATQQEAGVLVGHQSGVAAVVFNGDQRLVSSGFDSTVRIWDATSWQPLHVEGNGVVAWFSNDGRRIYSGGVDGEVRRWDSITKFPIGGPLRIDGRDGGLYPFGDDKVLSVETDQEKRTVQLWNANSGRPVSPPWDVMADNVAWADISNRIVAKTKSDVLEIFDARTARPLGAPIKPGDSITVFDVTSDGRFVATGGLNDNTARLWDGRNGEPLGEPMVGDNAIVAVAASRDGSRLAVSYEDFTMRLFDTATGEHIGDPMDTRSVAYALAFSPTGQVVAAGGDDGTIRVWDVGNQSLLGDAYKDHTGTVTSLYFNNEGTKLVSASADNTVRVWPVPSTDPDAARDALCSKLTHDMASERWDDLVEGEIDYVDGCRDLPEAEFTSKP